MVLKFCYKRSVCRLYQLFKELINIVGLRTFGLDCHISILLSYVFVFQFFFNPFLMINTKRVINIDTREMRGWGWGRGCDVYASKRQMIFITPMLAAHLAQIDKIIFHTESDEHKMWKCDR